MNSTLETLEDNKVKLSVTIEEAEFEPELAAAYTRIAKEVRMPGFRPGKVPRKLLEKQFGPAMAREEAMRTSMPDFYTKAVFEHDVDVIASPEIEVTAGHEDGDVQFDAIVEVRPVIEVSDYDAIKVEVESPEVTSDDVDERLDSIRSQHAELNTVDRSAAEDDHLTIDIAGTIDGEPVPGLTADDYDYVLGSKAVVPEIDDNLAGASAGDEVTFDAPHPDETQESVIDFTITVKEVQEQVLPTADDDFAKEASEFETIDELREDLEHRIGDTKRSQVAMEVDQKVAEALAALVDDELSQALIEDEMDSSAQQMAARLQSQGVSLEQYLQITGTTPEDFREQLREQAEVGARVDLALRAIATAEGLEVTEDDIDAELEPLVAQLDQPLADVKEQMQANGRLNAVRSDMRIRAAMEWVSERVRAVDADGNEIDRELLEPHDHADESSEEE